MDLSLKQLLIDQCWIDDNWQSHKWLLGRIIIAPNTKTLKQLVCSCMRRNYLLCKHFLPIQSNTAVVSKWKIFLWLGKIAIFVRTYIEKNIFLPDDALWAIKMISKSLLNNHSILLKIRNFEKNWIVHRWWRVVHFALCFSKRTKRGLWPLTEDARSLSSFGGKVSLDDDDLQFFWGCHDLEWDAKVRLIPAYIAYRKHERNKKSLAFHLLNDKHDFNS